MKNSKTTKKKWELKMKEKEPLQCWIVKHNVLQKPILLKMEKEIINL